MDRRNGCGYRKQGYVISLLVRSRRNIVKRLALGERPHALTSRARTDGCREPVRSQCVRIIWPYGVRIVMPILDHDSKFDVDVIAFLKVTGLEPKRTGLRAPAPHPRLNKQRWNRERAEATAPLSEAWAARRCRSPLLIRFSKSEP